MHQEMNRASQTRPKPILSVNVVSGFDDLMRAMAIRSAVYVGEQGRPYDHEFEGNDHHATHVLALVDGEPAGTCRIRYFGEFAKPERLAVLPKFRSARIGERGVAHAVAKFAFEFARRKGFACVYGHALEHLVRFWGRFGTAPLEDGEFEFEGYRCVAMAGWGDLPENALGLKSGHLVLVRREGDWDRPGALERGLQEAESHLSLDRVA